MTDKPAVLASAAPGGAGTGPFVCTRGEGGEVGWDGGGEEGQTVTGKRKQGDTKSWCLGLFNFFNIYVCFVNLGGELDPTGKELEVVWGQGRFYRHSFKPREILLMGISFPK